MTCISDIKSKRRLAAELGAALAISAALLVGTFVTSTSAAEWEHHDRDRRHHRGDDDYYRAPPVVYGSPYGSPYYASPYESAPYYAPPVVFGFPGINVHIR